MAKKIPMRQCIEKTAEALTYVRMQSVSKEQKSQRGLSGHLK